MGIPIVPIRYAAALGANGIGASMEEFSDTSNESAAATAHRREEVCCVCPVR
jgi:hypothetical protein